MKLLILSHTSYMLGGAEMSLLNTVDYWANKYDIEPIFILRRPLDKLATAISDRKWKYYDLEYTFWSHAVPPSDKEEAFRAAYRNSKAIKDIEQIIIDENPDLVLTNSIVCPWAALASHFQQKPHVWFVREYGDLDHGRIFEIGREKTFTDIGNLSDLVVTNSLTLASHTAQYVDDSKVTTMYTPFSLKEIKKKADEDINSPFIDEKSLKMVITGSLTPSKGQREAIEAMGSLYAEGANVELCIIGSNGPKEYLQELNRLIDQYDIKSRVHFVGFQANPLAYLKQAHVGIMASRKEAFGRVTFEYLATGRAVVGANSGATPEMVIDGQTGYLYEQGSAISLANALKNYVDNKELAEKHGENALRKASDMMQGRYNADALYEKILLVVSNKSGAQATLPINYLHHTFDYLETAHALINGSEALSVKAMVKSRLKQKTKTAYYKIKGIRTKVGRR